MAYLIQRTAAFLLLLSFLNVSNILAQEKVDKMPKPLTPFKEIIKAFYDKIDSDKMLNRIFVEVSIDESGLIRSSRIIKGNQNETDKAALDAVKQLKFTPAEHNGVKVPMKIVLPFPKDRKEASKLFDKEVY